MEDSGVVVIRYIKSEASTARATGGAISFYGGKTIHTFTTILVLLQPPSPGHHHHFSYMSSLVVVAAVLDIMEVAAVLVVISQDKSAPDLSSWWKCKCSGWWWRWRTMRWLTPPDHDGSPSYFGTAFPHGGGGGGGHPWCQW